MLDRELSQIITEFVFSLDDILLYSHIKLLGSANVVCCLMFYA